MKRMQAFQKLLALAIFAYFTVLFGSLNTGCKHQPLLDDDGVGPVDTTGPVDTIPIGVPCDPDSVYFVTDVLPILISNCAMSGCHNAASHKEGVILDNFQNVVATGEVRPFDPGDSELWDVITENDPGDRMPPPPAAALTQDQLAIIQKWINQGAQDLRCDPNYGGCDTVGVSYSQALRPVLDAYCTGCHSGSNPSGGIGLGNYTGVKAVAQNGKLLGSIKWSAGYQKMPQGGNQLDACTIAKFEAWIAEGAQEN